jgi:hypothetical protein
MVPLRRVGASMEATTVATSHSGWTTLIATEVPSELQSPHSPIGRGSGLKIRTVWVRVPLGARCFGW